MKMAREGLPAALRAAIQKAKTDEKPSRHEAVKVKSNGGFRSVSIEVVPMRGTVKGSGFLVLFEESQETKSPSVTKQSRREGRSKRGAPSETLEEENAQLTQELVATRETLQSIIEQQEAANEELQSANEEAQSANEELQSVNEELETSKEEIQSSNEELATVNEELQNRNQELGQLNNDMLNLFASVRAPIIMLGRDLRIRRFTPSAEKILNLIPADVGRPISDIKLPITTPDLESILTEVVSDVAPKEIEVQDRRGAWYLLRVLPYKTLDNRIDGAVLMLVDVDALKLAQRYAQSIVSTVREPLVILDADLRVVSANVSFYTAFQVSRDETEGQRVYDLGNRQWNIPALRQLLEDILPREKSIDNFVVEHDFQHIGRKTMRLNARRLIRAASEPPLILLAIEDITESTVFERITDIALGSLSPDELLDEIVRRLCDGFSADHCTVFLLDDEEMTLRPHAHAGVGDGRPEASVAVGEGIVGTVAATREPLVVDDQRVQHAAGPQESMVAVPITSGTELHGVLYLGTNRQRRFTEGDVALLRLAAERIAHALDREARVAAERNAREVAESESRAKDDFFAALSHELRTPMTSIVGWAQLSYLCGRYRGSRQRQRGSEAAEALRYPRPSGRRS